MPPNETVPTGPRTCNYGATSVYNVDIFTIPPSGRRRNRPCNGTRAYMVTPPGQGGILIYMMTPPLERRHPHGARAYLKTPPGQGRIGAKYFTRVVSGVARVYMMTPPGQGGITALIIVINGIT